MKALSIPVHPSPHCFEYSDPSPIDLGEVKLSGTEGEAQGHLTDCSSPVGT
jgi:hypothetical protein